MKSRHQIRKNNPAATEDELFYQAAIAELNKGYVRLNLMADALAQTAGDELTARPLYLQQVALKLKQEQRIKALLQATPNTTQTKSRPIDYTKLIAHYWYVLPLVLLIGILVWAKPVEPLQNLVPSVAKQLGFVQITAAQDTVVSNDLSNANKFDPTSASQSSIDVILYQQYPALDPNHPNYQAALAAQVSQLSQRYQQQGHSPEAAQQMAALSVLGRPNPAQDRQVLSYVPREGQVQAPDAPKAKPSASPCEHKPVMSNQDYLNCGIQPPTTGLGQPAQITTDF